MVVGGYVIPCSFCVLDKAPNIIFGLDMMKAHRIKIDLEKNALVLNNNYIEFLQPEEVVDRSLSNYN